MVAMKVMAARLMCNDLSESNVSSYSPLEILFQLALHWVFPMSFPHDALPRLYSLSNTSKWR
jgi:hypothetical protein